MPLKLLVPADYPRSSPMLVCDKGDEQMRWVQAAWFSKGNSVSLTCCCPLLRCNSTCCRKRFNAISGTLDVAFRQALCGLPDPMSVLDIAKAWDASVRRAVVEFAQRHGGGTFSSSYGEWARCWWCVRDGDCVCACCFVVEHAGQFKIWIWKLVWEKHSMYFGEIMLYNGCTSPVPSTGKIFIVQYIILRNSV